VRLLARLKQLRGDPEACVERAELRDGVGDLELLTPLA
jgi:hypothetical protein